MNVRLTQIDGKLPNLALMKLAHWHRSRGDEVHFSKRVERDMLEPEYDLVYGSAIFSFSADRVARFKAQFPGAIVGGTWNTLDNTTVEDAVGEDLGEVADYSIYPGFSASIGFTQRGCRLKCGFCVVPRKEGKPRSVNRIADLWRGDGFPKHLHLLDNDFFGQAEWQDRVEEIVEGGFRVCLNQGINIRMVDETSAAALARLPYYDDSFKRRILYTAWDNVGDEVRFFRGVDTLERHGIPPTHLQVYMLVGYNKRETWERVLYRFNKMVERKLWPYPMVFGDRWRGLPSGGSNMRLGNKTLAQFQRWVIRRNYRFMTFEEYGDQRQTIAGRAAQGELFA